MDTRALGIAPESQGVARLTVRRPDAFEHRPGQVAALARHGRDMGYYAIATPPGRPVLEFLVKRATADPAILGLAADDHIEVRGPFGAGFDLDAPSPRALFVGAGTALAALRPAILVALADRPAPALALVIGVRAPSELAFADELRAFAARAMIVRIVVSGATDPAYPYRGWVQDHVADLLSAETRLYLAGSDALEDAVEAVALSAGVPPASIQRNFRPDRRAEGS